ncbi:MAG TPA: TolC family protein, partial [Sphingomicrobium sp.]|nr:TolC family protein [Sphingomicrobium sp.]
ETALSRYGNEIARRQSLESARDQAEQAARITRAQLREGRADSLAVLDAERTLAQAEADLAEADARLANDQVDLFRALGGGWQTGVATAKSGAGQPPSATPGVPPPINQGSTIRS